MDSVKIKITKLILSGGGALGCSMVGAIRYLEQAKILPQIKLILGTSVGSVMGVLLCLGYNSRELAEIIHEFDYDQCQSIDLNSIFDYYGFDSFEKTGLFLGSLFSRKSLNPGTTFQQLYDKCGIHLQLNAVCLNVPETVLFDYLHYPDMKVITALQASMSLPFLFASVRYQGLTYTDGGLLSNFPVDLLSGDPESVLGIYLLNQSNYSIKDVNHLGIFTVQVIACINKVARRAQPIDPPGMHIIRISDGRVHSLNINLGPEDKNHLMELGYHKFKEYFEIILPLRLLEAKKEQNETETDCVVDTKDPDLSLNACTISKSDDVRKFSKDPNLVSKTSDLNHIEDWQNVYNLLEQSKIEEAKGLIKGKIQSDIFKIQSSITETNNLIPKTENSDLVSEDVEILEDVKISEDVKILKDNLKIMIVDDLSNNH